MNNQLKGLVRTCLPVASVPLFNAMGVSWMVEPL
jgi:hypothetical protein